MRIYFGIVAFVMLAGAAWLLLRRWTVVLRGMNAVAQVVGFEARESDGSRHYLPIFSFRDHRGLPHRVTAVAGGTQQRPPVGSLVTVRYLPDQPQTAFIVSFLHLWAAPLGLAVLGLGALAACLKV